MVRLSSLHVSDEVYLQTVKWTSQLHGWLWDSTTTFHYMTWLQLAPVSRLVSCLSNMFRLSFLGGKHTQTDTEEADILTLLSLSTETFKYDKSDKWFQSVSPGNRSSSRRRHTLRQAQFSVVIGSCLHATFRAQRGKSEILIFKKNVGNTFTDNHSLWNKWEIYEKSTAEENNIRPIFIIIIIIGEHFFTLSLML